ncbi:phenylalanine--tRNA ligase subunit beta [Galbitalea sp. SE-J8]|uniref:phenylalanine--tRNA ligase subunit beta n=1 Tax=Galbitalea sp. SE-J8 TaxID=3054952 RepID=UPI00259D2BF2|nr:phenylalanine--tRNA ligase subunit beta [Galbitalea sp. SE-J8]MDM4762528.1 phenylalanine--tRNA ligase subunit beta [Galbitalea sp. SE-J8]
MRVPASWLGEYVGLPEDVSAEHLHAALVRVGFEEEEVIATGISGPVVVGRVLSLEPEPQSNGKTINWCSVDVGPSTGPGHARDIRGIVCGAHNFGVGDKVVVTLPGAVLPGPFPIAARTTYGHVSDGMIASARELGLGEDHAGILRLAEIGLGDAPVGADAIALLGLDDFAVDVNVTPDRGYALSIRGLAREYALSTGAEFRDPAVSLADALEALPEPAGFPVTVADDAPIRGNAGCHGFVARVVRGIDPTRPTPAWMISRLKLAGIRSISLPVDITNYVMIELGQPLHGYDLGTLAGGITVRRARAGETLETLDGVVRALDPEDLVITDDSGPIGLAGVMGGAATEITAVTTDVLIEAAGFDRVSIARTARRHKLPSEASRRFERGVDPAVAAVAAARAAELLVGLAGGTIDELGAVFADVAPTPSILLRDGRAASLIGVDYTADEVRGAIEAIGASVEAVDGGLAVTPPSWRPDLVDDASLVEEVARITGYDRIGSVLPVAPPGRGLTRAQLLRRQVAASLAAAGLTEVLTDPFATDAQAQLFADPAGATVPTVVIANPLDATAANIRTSLVPGLIATAHRNLARGLGDLALFEVGSVARPEAGAEYGVAGALPDAMSRPSGDELAALFASVPPQPRLVSALFVGDTVPRQPGLAAVPAGIADALDAARVVAASVGLELRVEKAAHHALHPGRSAALFAGARRVGYAGELLPAIALEANLPRVVGVLELDLDQVIAAAPELVAASPISGYPAATQDLSLVVTDATAAAGVAAAVAEGAGALLESIRLVDAYRGQGVPEGSVSLTFALRFRADDRTLTAEEATAAKLAGVAVATERTGAAIRD